MNTFPIINNINDIKNAIIDRDEFIIAERDWGFVINYHVNFIDTFPSPNTEDVLLNEMYKLRRECRGIKFDLNGLPLARPFHKFFNVDEKDETSLNNIDLTTKFDILDKLDGSMIHPITVNGSISLCTKMGITDIANDALQFVENNSFYIDDKKVNINYMDFMKEMQDNGLTPLFEWMTRKQRIVVDYGKHDYLTLLAIRDIKTGRYHTYNEMINATKKYSIPMVKRWPGTFTGLDEFMNEVQNYEDGEGYIIRSINGTMHKIKNFKYVQLHKAKEALDQEKDVWMLVLNNNQDDLKPILDSSDITRLDNFSNELYNNLNATANSLKEIVMELQSKFNNSKKEFANHIINVLKHEDTDLLFKIWDGHDPIEIVYDKVKFHLGTGTRLEIVRHLANNINWCDYD